MIRHAISVEGDTEKAFVKEILANHLRSFGVEPFPVLINRARNIQRGGGNVTVAKMLNPNNGLLPKTMSELREGARLRN